jgi:ATP-dependent exoDNAse (exonuclease V) beta subunit
MEARIQSWTLPKQGELLFDKSFLDILAASAVRIHGNEISPEAAQVRINNVHSSIIPAYTLHHDKQKRKDAVLDALRDAAAAPYPQDAFVLDYTKEQYIPAKTSATALLSGSPVQYEIEDFREVPDFMREEVSYDAATRGIFTHTVMRFMDFAKGEGAIERNILPEDAKPEIDTRAIKNFLASDICKRILASPDVRRETPFVLKLSARDVYCDVDSDKKMLVQGIIDLCFMENGYWVLVDYKTNVINEVRTAESWLTHYTPQLETYKKALESLTGTPVREAGIYFLSKKGGQSFYMLG